MQRFLTLLFVLFLAPACAPNEQASEAEAVAVVARPIVLLTDAETWSEVGLKQYKDSLEAKNYRVIVSGFTGETVGDLVARLPWLLQPGVDLFLYDSALAGPAGADSLRAYIGRMNLEIPVQEIKR
jgi:hypothetical protein